MQEKRSQKDVAAAAALKFWLTKAEERKEKMGVLASLSFHLFTHTEFPQLEGTQKLYTSQLSTHLLALSFQHYNHTLLL